MSTTFHTTDELRFALETIVPAMRARGFTIKTPGYEFSLLPGRLADRLADELDLDLRLNVMHRTERERAGQSS
jgi:hypothetical protein